MLKIFFRIAILLPYDLHFVFRDQLRDERVALPTFPAARDRCASPSAFCVPAGATASGHCVE
jgi:hypothetical protein